jgi:hypothetical protein
MHERLVFCTSGGMNLQDLDSRNYFLAVGGFLAVLFAVLGPEGSTDLGLPARLLQWTAQVAIPLVLLISIHLLLSRSHAFDGLSPWLKLTISGVFGALLFAPAALTLDFLFGVDDWDQIKSLSGLLSLLLDEALGVVFPVTLVWVGINAPRVIGLDFSRPAGSPQAADGAGTLQSETVTSTCEQQSSEGFLRLLPGEIGTDIIYLMSELHYLRVVTTKGSTLVLYNLRDAVDELPADFGLQPHRSYWVAFRHLQRLVRREGKAYLALSDGSTVPVSRRRLSEVRTKVSPA